MVRKYLLALSAAGSLSMAVGGFATASAEEVAVTGANPGVRCATVAERASDTGSAGPLALQTCDQAIIWSHFMPDETGTALLNRGVVHLVRNEYEAAVADFTAAVNEGADLASALNDRGIAEAALHRYAAAEADYTKALAQRPDHPERLYFNRAVAYEDQGDLKQAYLDYRSASEANPKWDKAAKELGRFTVAHPSMS